MDYSNADVTYTFFARDLELFSSRRLGYMVQYTGVTDLRLARQNQPAKCKNRLYRILPFRVERCIRH